MGLDPVMAQVNTMVQEVRKDAPPLTAESSREGYAQFIESVARKETDCELSALDVEGMPAILFTPPSCGDGLLVWFHGGCWIFNSPELSKDEVDRLAVAAGCRVVSVDYPLAPEHPFPEPQLGGLVAAEWCVAHAEDLGADPSKVAVGGDSAGGNLAAVAAQRVDGLCAQVLVYPCCDLSPERLAAAPFQEGYLLDRSYMELTTRLALVDADPTDPVISPGLQMAAVLADAPPALVITAEYDLLIEDVRAYVAALRAAGVDVEARHYEHQTHLFFSMPELLEDARDAIGAAGAFLAARFEAP